jgi:serine/threonine protein kinase
MGALYLAVTGDKGFERLLCIKTVLPHLADKEYVARFRDEAKIVVQLSHGNLIPVFDAGQVGGDLFLAMEFIKGKDLRAVWNRCAKKAVAFPVDVAVYLTKELCRGLGYAHSYGAINLVHRDVSPPNVLLSYSGEVKLTDFGLASSTLKMEKTLPGIIYGKVAYMSPEQARGDKLDGRSDIYAAGIILWELLTGRQLFPPGEEQPQDLLKRARDPEVVAPSKKAPRVPKELDELVLRSLTADREDRYQNAEDFRDALGDWLAQNYPACDMDRVQGFIQNLFEEDIAAEEEERKTLIRTTRERVKTLPPTDELRRLLEAAGDAQKESDRRQEDAGPNPGRRAPDQGKDSADRRGKQGRRSVDTMLRGGAAGAVKVPKPRQDGSTVVASGRADSNAVRAPSVEVDPETAGVVDIMGQVLENRYRVEELIGEGGMGRVYLAEHVDIGKKFAIKVLHPVYGRMPDLVERFRREARAASKIGHPNIVDVTDSGTTDDGSVYFVMEHLQGVELAGVIDREGAIDIRRALDISTQVCRALSAAHSVGIIHRDLKPENIFLTAREGTSDFVKVLDFGIAKSSEAEEARAKKLTSPGMAMGTPEYMAPEQAAGKPADARCDVYALGAILYEMLTGQAPYSGDNFMEILTRKATTEPIPPRQLREEIPESVEELLIRTMARNPDDRPPSMEALEYELTKCFAGRGAAVANILGISQDDSFDGVSMAGSDPGFNADQSSPGTRARTVEPRSSSSEMRAQSVDGYFDEGSMDTVVPDVSGGGFRAMGWFFFAALLLSAGAAVFYVAKGESGAPRPAIVDPSEPVAVVADPWPWPWMPAQRLPQQMPAAPPWWSSRSRLWSSPRCPSARGPLETSRRRAVSSQKPADTWVVPSSKRPRPSTSAWSGAASSIRWATLASPMWPSRRRTASSPSSTPRRPARASRPAWLWAMPTSSRATTESLSRSSMACSTRIRATKRPRATPKRLG